MKKLKVKNNGFYFGYMPEKRKINSNLAKISFSNMYVYIKEDFVFKIGFFSNYYIVLCRDSYKIQINEKAVSKYLNI